MSLLLKSLVGGLIGGAVGALLAEQINPLLESRLPWAVLLAGLLAGFGARLACGRHRDFLTGLMAAVAAVLAICGVSFTASGLASKSAQKSMAAIPVKENFRGTPPVETVSTGEGEVDGFVGNELDPSGADSEARETVDASAATDNLDVTPVVGESGAAASDAMTNKPQTQADDRPAELGPSVDPWANGRSTTAKRQSPNLMSGKVLGIYFMSGFLAFVLGAGFSPAPVSDEESSEPDAASSDEQG